MLRARDTWTWFKERPGALSYDGYKETRRQLMMLVSHKKRAAVGPGGIHVVLKGYCG